MTGSMGFGANEGGWISSGRMVSLVGPLLDQMAHRAAGALAEGAASTIGNRGTATAVLTAAICEGI